MNRCSQAHGNSAHHLLPTLLALLIGVGSSWPLTCAAQLSVRQFPASAKRAMLEVIMPPEILLNGAAARLSPGARIKSSSNLIVMSGSLVGQSVLVNYLSDPQGLVHEVWILNEQEALEKRAGMEPVTNFSFESDLARPRTDDGKTPFNQLPSFPKQ